LNRLRRMAAILTTSLSLPILVATPAQSSAAERVGRDEVVVTTLRAVDAPPEQGGRPQVVPLSEGKTGQRPEEVLNNVGAPMAALLRNENAAEDVERGHPSSGPKAVAAAAEDVDLLDCYANPASERPEGWVVEHTRYCKVAFLVITRQVCSIFGGGCRETGSVRWRSGTIGRGGSGQRTINFVMVFDQWTVTGDGGSASLTVGMNCVMTVGSPCQNSNGLASSHTRTIPNWISAPTVSFAFSSPVPGSFGPDLISSYDFDALYSLLGANSVRLGTNTFRCDSAPYLPSAGCVFPRVTELFKLSRSDMRYSEAAEHIYFAQTVPWATFPLAPFKVIPGTPGSGLPLERNFYDENLRRLNHDSAVATCQLYYPLYTTLGQDCDEYPFQSTFQGAANGDNYSARAINLSHNRSAGGHLRGFYDRQRILHDYDPFYVMILQ
jgi:hypothetical protein